MTLASTDSAPASILIVDDEELLVLAFREMFECEGYRTVAAFSAAEALKRLGEEQFAVVLTDQNMPRENGLDFLGKVKAIQPDATRLLMTGVLDLSTVIQAINKGEIFRFIVKPCLREDLLATVKNAVQRYELISQNKVLHAATQAMNRQLAVLNESLEKQVAREAEQNRQLAGLNQALEQNLHRSVELCLKTMQTFYPSLGSRARRAHELCSAMADGLSLSPKQRQILEISAWLYDIGLVGVPRRIIRLWETAPEVLSPAEMALIHQHPIMGQELASFVHDLSEVGLVIRSHHERYDGPGYPDAAFAEQIPWLGRLLAVAVTCAENEEGDRDAMAVIKRGSRKLFDPEAVEVFTRFYRPTALRTEREITLPDLQSGMVVAKDIHTATGILLIPKGQKLNETFIGRLKSHDRVSPIKDRLLIYR